VKKYILIIALSVIIFPILSHAQEDSSSTDFSTPDFHMSMEDVSGISTSPSAIFNSPADVFINGGNSVNDMNLWSNAGDMICTISTPPTYFLLNSGNCSSYDNTLLGDYKITMATVASCMTNYDDCAASNPGIPGANEADFFITSGGGGGGDSTSTLTDSTASSTIDKNEAEVNVFNELYFFIGMTVSVSTIFGMMYAIRKLFG